MACGILVPPTRDPTQALSSEIRVLITGPPKNSLGAIFAAVLKYNLLLFSSSVMSNSATPWTAAQQASLSFTISWSLLKLMFIESVMPSNHLILCHPSPPAFNLSKHQGPFNELAFCIKYWPKHWSFSFSISPSSEYRVDFFSDYMT